MRPALVSTLSSLSASAASCSKPSTSRLLSSTSAASFLFRRPAAPSTSKIVDDLRRARENDRLDDVRRLFPSLLNSVTALAQDANAPVNRNELRALLAFVASAGKFSLALKMFNALELFGFTPDVQDHHSLLQAMANSGKLGKALSWIEDMPRIYDIKPSISDWNVLLSGYRKAGDLDGLRFCCDRIRASKRKLNVVSYNIIIAAQFEHGSIEGVKAAVEEMEKNALAPDLTTDTTLLSGYLDAGKFVDARAVAARLRAIVDTWNPVSEHGAPKGSDVALNALIKYECESSREMSVGLELAVEFAMRGHDLNTRTLNTLALTGAKELERAGQGSRMIEELENTTGQESDQRTWTIVLNAVLKNGGLDQALAVHQEARDRSIVPDAKMVQPLLSALLAPGHPPHNMLKAKELYEDLATASRTHSAAADASIYITLLRACADAAHPDIAFSSTLLADMKERGVELDSASMTWHIVALMRAAESFEEAFKAYDAMRATNVTALDHRAYNTILAAFTSLPFDAPAPPPLVLEFLGDMRRTSHSPSVVTYSLLLNYYSKAYKSPASVAQLHSLIKLDHDLEPDTTLFNTLMMAYARVGAYNSTYRVWDSMRANPHGGAAINDHSISIVFDTCGFEGGENGRSRAFKIWQELKREGHVRNLKHYDSYVECLLRLGDIARAEQFALDTMSPEHAPLKAHGVVAGVSTFETLIKLTKPYEGEWDRIRARIRDERPELWPQLRDIAKYRNK